MHESHTQCMGLDNYELLYIFIIYLKSLNSNVQGQVNILFRICSISPCGGFAARIDCGITEVA